MSSSELKNKPFVLTASTTPQHQISGDISSKARKIKISCCAASKRNVRKTGSVSDNTREAKILGSFFKPLGCDTAKAA